MKYIITQTYLSTPNAENKGYEEKDCYSRIRRCISFSDIALIREIPKIRCKNPSQTIDESHLCRYQNKLRKLRIKELCFNVQQQILIESTRRYAVLEERGRLKTLLIAKELLM